MKYEAKIDLRNANTSHALLVELVGRDRRVLDVGCAAGDLGRVLKRRGCHVAGVELDRAAADAAERHLDEVLIGDVNEMDLVKHFGKGSFDVVVFGDVLEHLADPVAILRKVRPLLTGSGSIVASLPNVAHGAVRLALLKGQFDYRPLGLLDATHLRFFTRGSVHATFREAGLVPVDMRRTTAGVFDTEIGVRRADFDEGIVDAVEGDPESTTYQFVLRAVPEDSLDAITAHQPVPEPAHTATTRVGLVADWAPDDLRTALAVRVAHEELTRRLPGAAIRVFSSSPRFGPSPHDGGIPVEPLGTWSPERASRLSSQLDCIVVTGDLPGPGDGERQGGGAHPARALLEGPGAVIDAECPVVWGAVRLPADARAEDAPPPTATYGAVVGDLPDASTRPAGAMETVPDPLLLVPRLLREEALARRLNFVRMMGWFPADGPAVVVEADGSLVPHAGAVARALDSAVADAGAGIVLVQTRADDATASAAADAIAAAMAAPAYRVPGDALVDDVVAVIAGARALVACSPSAMALGSAYGVPVAEVEAAGDLPLRRLPALVSPAGAAPTSPAGPHPGTVEAMRSRLDAHFDRIATIADAAAAARPRPPEGHPALSPPEYVAAMELAHRRMRQRLLAERDAVADHLGGLHHRHEAELGRSQAALQALRAERDALSAEASAGAARGEHEARLRRELDRVTAELEALKGIRILRVLRPARAVYARLRGGHL